jgi:hypothetical protein
VRATRRILAFLAVTAAAAMATGALAAEHPWVPERARVTAYGLTAGTERGSFCSSRTSADGGGVTGCADYAYPLHPRAYLPIAPGAVVRVDVRRRAGGVTAGLVRVDGNEITNVGSPLTAEPVDSGRRVWRLRLPQQVADATALSISARWPGGSGDANWWAGVRPVAGWPFRSRPYLREREGAWAPRHAVVRTSGLRTGTALGSYCSERRQGNGFVVGCADMGYPLHPRTTVPITPGADVLVDVRRRANVDVTAQLERVDGNDITDVGPAMVGVPVDSRRRLWRLTLPPVVAGATDLSITGRFTIHTDANWWAGVRPFARWP